MIESWLIAIVVMLRYRFSKNVLAFTIPLPMAEAFHAQ